MSEEGPYKISDRVVPLKLTGYLLLVRDDDPSQPYPLRMPGTADLFLAVFSTQEKLDQLCSDYQLAPYQIKQILHGPAFLVSVLGTYRVMVDPYKAENGRMRFVEFTSFGAKA